MSPPTARIDSLDILRGFALLGMILVHIHQGMEVEAGGIEGLVGWIVWMGVEQKAWATFALLFGAGFAILIRRLETKGQAVASCYLRRLLGLYLIGIVVYVCWGYQILMDYAVWGVPLLFVRTWSTRALLILAMVSVVAKPLTALARGTYAIVSRQDGDSAAPGTPSVRASELEAARGRMREAQRQSSYAVLVRARAGALVATYRTATYRFFLPTVNLALFILGFLAIRHGVFEDPRRHARSIGALAAAGAMLWAASWWLLPLIPEGAVPRELAFPVRAGLGIVSDQWLALTYVGALLLLLTFRPRWLSRLAFMGWSGRMALTNYIAQAALIDAAAMPYGAGLRIRPYAVVFAAAALFGVQTLWSRRWLTRHRLGPVEWLLRSLTYGKPQPLRIRDT